MYSVRLLRRSCQQCPRPHLDSCAARQPNSPWHGAHWTALATSFSSATKRRHDSRSDIILKDGGQDHFPGSTGFFPDRSSDEGAQLVRDVEQLIDRTPRDSLQVAQSKPFDIYASRHFHSKIDFSYTDPQDHAAIRKIKQLQNQQSAPDQPFFQHSYETAHSLFRTSNDFRRATAGYITHVKYGAQAHVVGIKPTVS